MIVQRLSSDRINCNLHESVTQAVLTPGRYVGIADVEDDGEPFEEKTERLTVELSELFAESREAEEEIRSQLKSVGFEV
jgi:type I restriction enzyme M protein